MHLTWRSERRILGHLASLHQTAHDDKSKVEYARHDGVHGELGQDVHASRAEMTREIHRGEERASVVREAAHIIKKGIL